MLLVGLVELVAEPHGLEAQRQVRHERGAGGEHGHGPEREDSALSWLLSVRHALFVRAPRARRRAAWRCVSEGFGSALLAGFERLLGERRAARVVAEGVLHQAVFARVKRDDRRAPAVFEQVGQLGQQRLELSTSRFTAMRSAWNVRVAGSTPLRLGPSTRTTARRRSSVVCSSPRSSAALMERAIGARLALVAVLVEHVGQLVGAQPLEQLRAAARRCSDPCACRAGPGARTRSRARRGRAAASSRPGRRPCRRRA